MKSLDSSLWRLSRRTIDICISLPIVLFVFPPLALFVRLIIQRGTPGPLLYRAHRSGQSGSILTFRTMPTMRINDVSEFRGLQYARLVQRMSLKDFPKFLQVLIGEISLANLYSSSLDFTKIRDWDDKGSSVAVTMRRRSFDVCRTLDLIGLLLIPRVREVVYTPYAEELKEDYLVSRRQYRTPIARRWVLVCMVFKLLWLLTVCVRGIAGCCITKTLSRLLGPALISLLKQFTRLS